MTIPEKFPPPVDKNKPASQPDAKSEAEFPVEAELPEDFTPIERPSDLSASSRARRRRARRSLVPAGEEQGDLLDDLARSSFPSFDFFLYALLCGLLMGAGFLLDSHALLLLALVAAPLLAPWFGMILAVATGGWRFFFQTLSGLVIAFVLSFFASALAGLLVRFLDLTRFTRAGDAAKLWWTDLLIVFLGAVLFALAQARGNRRPSLQGILLAYGFFLPLGAAGFAWSSGMPGIFPDGILVFLTHLALARLVGVIVLKLRHFKPARKSGSILLILLVLVCLAALASFTGLTGWLASRAEPVFGSSNPTPLGLVSPTPGLPPSATPGGPTRTTTDEPTVTPSISPTSTQAPIFAVIAAATGGGAVVRAEPGGEYLATLINGAVVEVLPDTRLVGTVPWTLIRSADGLEGWVLQAVLVPVTPAPAPGSPTP